MLIMGDPATTEAASLLLLYSTYRLVYIHT